MGDTALYGFQLAEVLDSLRLAIFGLLIFGIALWVRTAHFGKRRD